MAWQDDLTNLLQTSNAGTAVYPGRGPSNPPFPHITYSWRNFRDVARTRDGGTAVLDNQKVQVNIKGETYKSVKELAENVESIIRDYSGTPQTGSGKFTVRIDNAYDDVDVGEDTHRIIFDCTIWRRNQ